MRLYFNILNFNIKIQISNRNKNNKIKWNLQNISDTIEINQYVNAYADDNGLTDVRHLFHNKVRRWAFFEYLKLHPEINRIEIIDYLYGNGNTLYNKTPYQYTCIDQELLLGFKQLGYIDAINYLVYFKNIEQRK